MTDLPNPPFRVRQARRRSRYALAASLAALLGACTTTAGADGARVASAASEMPAGDFDYKGWDSYLGGIDSSQYSSLDQVNVSNVSQLQVAWEFPTGEGTPPLFNPLVAGGRMYVTDGAGQLVALEPTTGKEIWRSSLEGRIGVRGTNYWSDGSDERLFVINNGMLRAIDAKTGQVVQGFAGGGVDLRDALPEGAVIPAGMLQTSNPGRVFEDLIIVSLPAGAYDYASAPADIQAYDVRTGELKWVFHTVPQEGEFGYDTWPAKDHEKFGGVHNWSEFTIDPELGIAYIPTGTARYDFYGGNREGDNLFGNSLIALDARTGKRIWHYQFVHHDLWDYDNPNAPKLMTITNDGPGGNGEQIPVVIAATKMGFVFVFDRRTGEPVWPIEERPVPASDVPGEKASPTQPFPTWPQPFARQGKMTVDDINPYIPEADKEKLRAKIEGSRNEGLYTPPSLQGTISWPGHNGGANFGTSAVDPVNKRFFVVSREIPVVIKLFPDARPEAMEAMPNGSEPMNPYKSPVDFMLQSNGMVGVKPPWSFLTAYDMNTGKILYRIPDGESLVMLDKGVTGTGSQAPRGAPVATAGGLLFVGTAGDRKFRARDQATGKVLWEYDLGAATEGAPAIFEVDGREYITLPVGGNGLFAQQGAPEPGPSKYVTFALPAGAQ